jgi:vancomycin resistance protein YoaR
VSIVEGGPPAVGSPQAEGRTRSRAVKVMLGALGVLVVAYGVLFALAGDRVPRGTTVEGVAIGGLTTAAAEDRLRETLEPRSRDPIVVTGDGSSRPVDPSDAGLSVDFAASVAAAGGGRSLSPARLWRHYLGSEDVEAVVDIDEDSMDQALSSLAEAFDVPPVDGAVTFRKGSATPVAPREGHTVDLEATREALADHFLHEGSVAVPLSSKQPAIGAAAVDEAMDTFAEPAMSGPVTIRLEGEEIVAPPRLFGQALSMTPQGTRLVLEVDGAKLSDVLQGKLPTLGKEPVDATFRIVRGRPKLVPARSVVTFDQADLQQKFAEAVVKAGDQRVAEVSATVAQPELTTPEAKAFGIKERVSTFTTYFPYAEYRNINLTRAASLINGTLLEPGETFSLNQTVGERTKENGFTEGFIIKDGLFRLELGGGVSQIATTTFNAMFFAGLEDVQHKPHSVYISRYPEGREATVAWPSVDLRFRNTTPHGIFIAAHVVKAPAGGQGSATVSMYSTTYWDISTRKSARYAFTSPPTRYLDAPDCEASDGGPGFAVDVFRTFRKAGTSEVERTEKFHTVYNPEPRLICGKKPAGQRSR